MLLRRDWEKMEIYKYEKGEKRICENERILEFNGGREETKMKLRNM